MSNILNQSDNDSHIDHDLVRKLVLELQDEGEYLIELERKTLESVYDAYKLHIIGIEINETMDRMKKKDMLLKTVYKIGSYKECLTK